MVQPKSLTFQSDQEALQHLLRRFREEISETSESSDENTAEEGLGDIPIDQYYQQHSLLNILRQLHPSDFAQLVQYLTADERALMMMVLGAQANPEFLLFLDNTVQQEVIYYLPQQVFSKMIEDLETDDGVVVLENLGEQERYQVLENLSTKKRQQLKKRLLYPESSAGRLMQEDALSLPAEWSLKIALEHIAHAQHLPENFYELYVLDSYKKPIGVVHLSQLIKKPKHLTLQDIMDKDFHCLPTTMHQNEVADWFRKYDLISAPVVNEHYALVGMITVDDVVDVIDEKAEEDLMHMGRIANSDFYSPIINTSINRMRWLIVTLINSILASLVIDQFEAVHNTTGVVPLMSIVAAMAGNSGMQSVTVTLRALAAKELGVFNMKKAIFKEVAVALLNGFAFAALLGSVAFYWYRNFSLSCILGGAIVFDMLWAGLAGTFFPIIVSHFKKDPTLSAGPLLTTSTDVLGFAIFLGLAQMFL